MVNNPQPLGNKDSEAVKLFGIEINLDFLFRTLSCIFYMSVLPFTVYQGLASDSHYSFVEVILLNIGILFKLMHHYILVKTIEGVTIQEHIILILKRQLHLLTSYLLVACASYCFAQS